MKKKQQPNVSWEIIALLTVLLFLHGAYSAVDFIPVALSISALLFISIIYKVITKSNAIQLNWLTVACFAIGASYTLTLFNSVSMEQSGLKVVEWFTYGLLFLWLPKYRASTIQNSLLLFSGIFVVAHIILLFGAFTNEGVILYLNEGLSLSGMRLNGWFQYANATGAIAGALWLYLLQTNIHLLKWRVVQFVCLLGLPFILMLTESRGALLVVTLISLVIIVLRKEMRQRLLISSAAAILAYISVVIIGHNIIGFVVALLILIGVGIVSEKYGIQLQTKNTNIILLLIIVLSAVIAGVFNFNALLNRLSLATLTDRIVYIQDAWRAIQDAPLLGYGGESWEFVKYSYQSAPYIVNDLHMFYVQHLLETGFVGFTILMILLAIGLYYVIKLKSTVLLPITVLLINGCIDFTLSYSMSIVLLLLFFYEVLSENKQITIKPVISYIMAATFSIGICIFTFCWQQAEQSYKLFIETGYDNALDKAIQLNPYRSKYYYAKIHDQSSLQDDIKHYEKMLELEPYSAHIHIYLAEAYETIDLHKAINHYKLALSYDKFDRLKYELAIEGLTRINTQEANELKNRLQQQFDELQNSEAALNVRDQRDFFHKNK